MQHDFVVQAQCVEAESCRCKSQALVAKATDYVSNETKDFCLDLFIDDCLTIRVDAEFRQNGR